MKTKKDKSIKDEEILLEKFREAYGYTEMISRWFMGFGATLYHEKGFGGYGEEEFQRAYPNLPKEEKERLEFLLDVYSSVMKKIGGNTLRLKVLGIKREKRFDEYYQTERYYVSLSFVDNLRGKTSLFFEGSKFNLYANFEVLFHKGGIEILLNHDIDDSPVRYKDDVNKVKKYIKEVAEDEGNLLYKKIIGLIEKGLKKGDEKKNDSEFNRVIKSLEGKFI